MDIVHLSARGSHVVLARADPPDPVEVLSAAGWTAASVSLADLQTRYGRRLSLDASPGPATESRGGFVTAHR